MANNDIQLLNGEIPPSQNFDNAMPNFNLEFFDDDCTYDMTIAKGASKIDEILRQRHYTATLTKDLRRFSGSELPTYARIPKATFAPFLGDQDSEEYFNKKITEFNEKVKSDFREFLLDSAKERTNDLTKQSEASWTQTCTLLDGKAITKFNDKVIDIRSKWAAEYQKSANVPFQTKETSKKGPEEKKPRFEGRVEDNNNSDISYLKREIRNLKRDLDFKKRGGMRGRRY